ncbi:hypothetical protein HYH02_014855 [Chlamydomonas schloesseri]|uniref:THIF-type NAD/FAD binding fold domain-containing protein n=1 Tax=Chlamydomonas schloesseri TaxID=2026947 RepID=A0A835ST27_9CHLO|nr:hypothetical protein HYH02_014855 [Chlamydomonas schloesseri]|eukprot:KAG2426140.1 hypothetical protein HYH02_014855 [Chlamydomonas schloesseri]
MNPLMAVAVEPGPPHAAALLPAHHHNQQQQQQGQGQHGHAHHQGPGESGAEALRALLGRYDLVVAVGGGPAGAGLPLEQVAALDGAARRLGVGLFAGAGRGPSAWVFVDLGGEGEGGAGYSYTLKGETERRSLTYASFGAALGAGLGGIDKRTHPLYLVLRACWQFEQELGRPPAGAADVPAVRAAFDAIAAAAPAGAAAVTALLPVDLLESFVIDGAAPSAAAADGAAAAAASAAAGGLSAAAEESPAEEQEEPQGELAPVCAVVGGVVANNVLRALSAVNAPLRNFFFYSYLVRDGLGVEECFV